MAIRDGGDAVVRERLNESLLDQDQDAGADDSLRQLAYASDKQASGGQVRGGDGDNNDRGNGKGNNDGEGGGRRDPLMPSYRPSANLSRDTAMFLRFFELASKGIWNCNPWGPGKF